MAACFEGEEARVMIIDDNEINRELLKNIFENSYKTEEAENGREGLEKILDHAEYLSAILLDVVMPEMDGIEVMRELNARGVQKKVPVFLITADPRDEIVREAYSLGVMDVIGKPVVPYVVKRRVDSVVELFEARKRLLNRVEEQESEIFAQAQRIIELNKGMIEALSTAIEFRSGESGEHVRRIHDITAYMLENTPLGNGLSKEEKKQIAIASIMHDVGKIAVPDAILNKPGKLTPDEFEIMKTHTIKGAELLERIPQMKRHNAFKYAYDIARHHRERYDGRGYPDGLKGGEITVWAQIVSLADVYDALVSKRVYKDAYSVDQAVEMIRTGQCGVFDPVLMESFLACEADIRRIYRR